MDDAETLAALIAEMPEGDVKLIGAHVVKIMEIVETLPIHIGLNTLALSTASLVTERFAMPDYAEVVAMYMGQIQRFVTVAAMPERPATKEG